MIYCSVFSLSPPVVFSYLSPHIFACLALHIHMMMVTYCTTQHYMFFHQECVPLYRCCSYLSSVEFPFTQHVSENTVYVFFLSFFPSFLLSFFYNLTETIVMQILHFVKRYSAFCPDSACILLFCYVVYCSTKLDAISLLDCICFLSYPLQLY